ncbi:bifunctional lysylphosphatidylglycerol flippase/synthetase MprF [Novosphingobium sp. 9U]|uniref:bifunctional lysylphosphatidylglycerol flippase/synthetase MprF n=1 Tax=Novosphingobium sp. 9U TaxID=2653158 RepID=UPI00135B850E|nr:bifunctional lysylphosphatidylglycerol flippase/synthetase MprF [Novosphingobium sp. 9U]
MLALRAFLERYRRALAVAVIVAVIALGFVALDRLTHEVRYSDVRAAVHGLSGRQIALSLVLTTTSYLALTFYDMLALRAIGRPLPWRTAALASFSSYTLSHNLGLSLLTGGSARYRIYTAAGLDGPDIARVVAIAAAMFWAGVVTIAGLAMLVHNGPLQLGSLMVEARYARVLGGILLAVPVALVMAANRLQAPLARWKVHIPLPGRADLIAQILVALVDITCASAALFVLLPDASVAQLPAFVLGYALGLVAALASHVPGGIGIFESVVLAVVPSDRTALFAALIAYRLIYYLLPLALGVVLLAWHEARRSRRVNRLFGGVQAVVSNLSPLLLSAATFLSGAMLLLSGSLPAIHARMGPLAAVLPLPFIEASHIGASLVGTALLLLSPGLYRRLDGACLATRVLLVAGAVFSLAKGFDYEEAAACIGVAALLHGTRSAFYRHTALTRQPLTAGWLTATAMVAALAAWAGLFAYRHVPYSDDLWWEFALHGDAPRYLRATLASAVFLTGFAIWRLLAPTLPVTSASAQGAQWPLIQAILSRSSRSEAMLALTGDKRFLISEEQDAFLMYQVKGTSWVVMGDPVGERRSWAALLWRLREMSHRCQGRILLYEVSPQVLDLAIGMGLQIVKYGEEAVVDLPGFDLQTPALRSLRKSQRVAARAGATFRIVPAAAVPVILDDLQAVSNAWMQARNHQEKGFSLGRFERAYVRNFDVALVMVEDRIVAFANLWLTADKQEASVDLMRHSEDAPAGAMDFLFVHLLLWAKERGYQRFILGMVPLSGIDARPLAPAWAKAAALVFRHGNAFYGFRGLRSYKEKFAPRWEPRYVAGPPGLGLIQGLHDVSRLIGRASPGTETPCDQSPTALTLEQTA